MPLSLPRMVFICVLFCGFQFTLTSCAQNSRFEKPREWVDITGKHTIEAKIVSASRDSVVLLNEATGNEKEFLVSELSEKDQEWIKRYKASLLSDLKVQLRNAVYVTEALQLVNGFEASGLLDDKNAVYIQGKKEVYEKHVADNAIILGTRFVSQAELAQVRQASKALVDGWIAEANQEISGADQKSLRRATREDPSSIEANILAALHYDVKMANFENAIRLLEDATERGEKFLPIASASDRQNLVVALNNLAVSCSKANMVSKAIRFWEKAHEVANEQLPSPVLHNIAKVNRMINSDQSGISVKRTVSLRFEKLVELTEATGVAGGWQIMLPQDRNGTHRSNLNFVIQDAGAQVMGTELITDTRCVKCEGSDVLRCPSSVCNGGGVEKPIIGNRTMTYPDGTVVDMGLGQIGKDIVRCPTCTGKGTVRCPHCNNGRQNN